MTDTCRVMLLSPVRKVIAARMTAAKQRVPHQRSIYGGMCDCLDLYTCRQDPVRWR